MTVRFDIGDAFPQILVIDLEGETVAQLEGNAAPDDEETVPNLITHFIKAVNLGMFAGPRISPSQCGATLLERSAVVDGHEQRYQVALRGCDPAALRVLGNLIVGLELGGHVFNEPVARGPRLDPFALDYTRAPESLPFPFEFDVLDGTQVALEFVDPVTDALAERVMADLELWSLMVVACGYPPEGRSIQHGAEADGALLFDSHTVTEGFSLMFRSDSSAFHPVAYYALALHEAGTPIARLRVT